MCLTYLFEVGELVSVRVVVCPKDARNVAKTLPERLLHILQFCA